MNEHEKYIVKLSYRNNPVTPTYDVFKRFDANPDSFNLISSYKKESIARFIAYTLNVHEELEK